MAIAKINKYALYPLLLFLLLFFFTQPTLFHVKLIQEATLIPFRHLFYTIDTPLHVQANDENYLVPSGFKTDLATIPRWLWSVLPPNEADFVFPAILHDYLYVCPHGHSRHYIDEIFYSFLIERGVSRFKAYQFYIAVELFGESHFNKESCL